MRARRTCLFFTIAIVMLMTISAAGRSSADTYDSHTLVRIEVPDKEAKQIILDSGIDVVNAYADWVKALVREVEREKLERAGLRLTVLHEEMATDRLLWAESENTEGANYYFTASAFNMVNPPASSLMKYLLDLHNAHPTITRLYDIGDSSAGGYDIIAMKITRYPDSVEAEPKIRLYGNIHGDEKSGMMVTMDVLEWILTEYVANNQTAKKLVDGAELWFIPMGNPWGAANNSRYNSNYIDLNRNFWGPIGNDSGTAFSEKETQAIRDLTEVWGKRFATSISFHSGEICFNSIYNYTSTATTEEPLLFSARTGGPQGEAVPAINGIAHAYQLGCTTSGFWYTNGYDWYQTRGDTNDWSYALWSDIDTTVEVTLSKTPSTSQIPIYTAEHRQAVINYMMKTFQGITGVMTDMTTGEPLDGTLRVTATQSATIPVPHVYKTVLTDPLVGDFHRVLQPATYTVECMCDGYQTKTITNVAVTANTTTVVNCSMNGTDLVYGSTTINDSCPDARAEGDGYLDAGEIVQLMVTVANDGVSAASGGQVTLSTSSPQVTIVDGSATIGTIPAESSTIVHMPGFTIRIADDAPCGIVLPFTLTIIVDQGTFTDNFSLVVGKVVGGTTEAFFDNFETNKGWSLTSAGEWQRATPQALGGLSYGKPDPAAAYSGSMVLGNDLTGLGSALGDYQDNVSNGTATSPAIDCTGLSNVQLQFRRWLNVEQPSYDQARVEVSTNGTTWTQVWQNPTVMSENSWTLQTIDMSTLADDQPNVRVRFCLTTDTSQRYSGWNIDDVRVIGDGTVSCTQDPCNQVPVPELSTFGLVLLSLVLGTLLVTQRRRVTTFS